MEYNNELYHYGVLGMKWGVIRSGIKSGAKAGVKSFATKKAPGYAMKPVGQKMSANGKGFSNNKSRQNIRYDKKIAKKIGTLNSGYKQTNARQDYKTIGKGGVKRINKRMNNGKTYGQAYGLEIGRQAATSVVTSIGVRLAASAAITALATKGMQYANRDLPRLSQNHYFDPIDADFKILN